MYNNIKTGPNISSSTKQNHCCWCMLPFDICKIQAIMEPEGWCPLRKIRIGLDFCPSCIIHTAGPKKVGNTSTLCHQGCRSQVQTGTENWYRKPMRGFKVFRSGPIPCLFSEWKSALSSTTIISIVIGRIAVVRPLN